MTFIKCINCGATRTKGFPCECVVVEGNNAPFKIIESECCGAKIVMTDICSACKEHI